MALTVLGLTTSTARVGVALWRDGEVLREAEVESGRRHAEVLAPAIHDLLGACGVPVADLDAVAVDMGPGGFTGLRIGHVTARALAAAAGGAVAGISSFEALVHPVRDLAPAVVCAVDARKGQVFTATWRDGQQVGEPEVLPAADLAARLDGTEVVVGDGALRYAAALSPARIAPEAQCWPKASVFAALAARRLEAGGADFLDDLLYVRKPYYA